MNKEQVTNLLDFLKINYPNFEIKRETTKMWLQELQVYDEEDVKGRLKELMADEYYQRTPPLLSMIIKGLTPKHEKIDYSKLLYTCNICNRIFDDKEVYENHFDRCSSVQYILKQYKKWFSKDLNKRELYEMSQEEFDSRYKKLLEYIYQHTTDLREKTRIGFIFNPPSRETAKKYLGGN